MDSEEPPNVRVACSGDIDEVVRLMHDAAAWMSAKGTPAWDVARIDRTFAETFVLRSELLVASCSDGIVGCCTLSAEDPEFWPDALKGEAAYLHKLAVRRTHPGTRYRYDYTDADHRELLAVLDALPASVMISGYPSSLYSELLPAPRWRVLSYQAMTRGGPRTECLWMNYAPDAAHWATHAGVDFTDRQRIKRKAARWKRMFSELPAGERIAILAALLEVDS